MIGVLKKRMAPFRKGLILAAILACIGAVSVLAAFFNTDYL